MLISIWVRLWWEHLSLLTAQNNICLAYSAHDNGTLTNDVASTFQVFPDSCCEFKIWILFQGGSSTSTGRDVGSRNGKSYKIETRQEMMGTYQETLFQPNKSGSQDIGAALMPVIIFVYPALQRIKVSTSTLACSDKRWSKHCELCLAGCANEENKGCNQLIKLFLDQPGWITLVEAKSWNMKAYVALHKSEIRH